MAAKENLTKAANINVTAREIDFVSRFNLTWEALRNILGIMRPIKMVPGTMLKSKHAKVTLQPGNVGEGEEVPYSLAEVTEKDYAEIDLEKYRKATSAEAIKKWGYDIAVAKTDEAFINELQGNVMKRFYDYLNSGELTNVQSTYQAALAFAVGLVINKWEAMQLTSTRIVGFGNVLDVYEYLSTAPITVQTQFGFNYIKNFMGYDTFFLLSEKQIPRGTVIATPVENICLYYVDPADSNFARAGLVYTTVGETSLIGAHMEGNYNTVVSENNVLMGLTLFSEYIDGIAVVKIGGSGSIGSLTASSTAGEEVGGSVLNATGTFTDDMRFFYKAASTAPSADYLETLDGTWTQFELGDEIDGLTSGNKVTIVATNGTRQALAKGNTTVTVKS